MLDFNEIIKQRLTLVSKVEKTLRLRDSRQYCGLPAELNNGVDSRSPMPSALWLFIRPYPHSNSEAVELYRFASNGQAAGDSWHTNYNEATEQAFDEYDVPVDSWKVVPHEKWGDLNYSALLFGPIKAENDNNKA